MAKGSVTFTEKVFDSVRLMKAVWTADASGSVSSHATSKVYNGRLIYAATVPNSTSTPSASYDVYLMDSSSVDVAAAALKSQAVTSSAQAYGSATKEASLGAIAYSKLNLKITGAGNATKGIVYAWIR